METPINKQAQPIIEIRSLGKTFHTKSGDVKALDDINITIHKGDIFGIIDMSGAGKSTLYEPAGETNRGQRFSGR